VLASLALAKLLVTVPQIARERWSTDPGTSSTTEPPSPTKGARWDSRRTYDRRGQARRLPEHLLGRGDGVESDTAVATRATHHPELRAQGHGVKIQVFFPSFGMGNTDAADTGSHVAYGLDDHRPVDGKRSRHVPKGFPV